MKIATLSIGSELLTGECRDRNATVIAAALADAGLEVRCHLVVPDDTEAICRALQDLSALHDAVIVSGGLGTGADDATAAGAAKAAGIATVPRETALEGSPLIPQRANRLGADAGFSLQLEGSILFFLPGAPAEMESLLKEAVLPQLAPAAPAREVLKLFGMTREKAAAAIAEVLPWGIGVRVSFREKDPELQLILSCERGSEDTLRDAVCAVEKRLHPFVFGRAGETLDSVLAQLFRATGATLSLAESCTGGLIAGRITEQPGSSAWLLEGAVTYSNGAKMRSLQVTESLLAQHGAVSAEVAMAMASGSRAAAGSDLAVAVTGIAGPDGGSPQKPVGTVFIALADEAGCHAERYLFPGNRQQVRRLTVLTALDWLRRRLLAFPLKK